MMRVGNQWIHKIFRVGRRSGRDLLALHGICFQTEGRGFVRG